MDTPTPTNHDKNHRFPVEIISHAVWLYFRFCLSFRDVEEIVGMQMTKSGLLATWAGWHYIANFRLLPAGLEVRGQPGASARSLQSLSQLLGVKQHLA